MGQVVDVLRCAGKVSELKCCVELRVGLHGQALAHPYVLGHNTHVPLACRMHNLCLQAMQAVFNPKLHLKKQLPCIHYQP